MDSYIALTILGIMTVSYFVGAHMDKVNKK
jgi:hypothetical protein